GYDGISLLQTVEKYDINLGRWSQMAPMLTPRSGTIISSLFFSNI
ncbi:unnamed protein product, partial [Rotaria sp. Silwood1]